MRHPPEKSNVDLSFKGSKRRSAGENAFLERAFAASRGVLGKGLLTEEDPLPFGR